MSASYKQVSRITFIFLFFICFGMAAEVCFTALQALVQHRPIAGKPLIALAGITYVWMAFIYALIPLLGFLFYDKVKHIPFYFRLPAYVVLLYGVEFSSGYLLRLTTGSCPWEYTTGWQVMGLIRLDYFPAWLFFVWFAERLFVFVRHRVV